MDPKIYKKRTSSRQRTVPSSQEADYRKFVNDMQNMSDGAFNQFMNNMETRARLAVGAQQKKGW